LVENVAARFSEETNSKTLTKGRRWSLLIRKLEGLVTQVKDMQTKDWSKFFKDNFFGGVSPDQRRAVLPPTPENAKLLEQYSKLFQQYINYRSKIPQDACEFETLRSLSRQLAQIKFQEDVPINVRKFFEATSAGASLDLLTNEVIDWLRKNNLLGSYVVRARIN